MKTVWVVAVCAVLGCGGETGGGVSGSGGTATGSGAIDGGSGAGDAGSAAGGVGGGGRGGAGVCQEECGHPAAFVAPPCGFAFTCPPESYLRFYVRGSGRDGCEYPPVGTKKGNFACDGVAYDWWCTAD